MMSVKIAIQSKRDNNANTKGSAAAESTDEMGERIHRSTRVE